MPAKHQHLAIGQVIAGMILADVLLGAQGQVLLPQGTVLSEAMLALMPRHGIDMLPILVPEEISIEELDALRAQRLERLAHIFRKYDPAHPGDAASGLLHRYITAYRLGQGAAA